MKKYKLGVYYFVAFAVLLLNILFMIKDRFFYDIEDLPEGQFLYSSLSPTAEKSVHIYLIETPNGVATRGELIVFEENGEPKYQNIYWQLGVENVMVDWLEEGKMVRIDPADGSNENAVILNVIKGETYDCRKLG